MDDERPVTRAERLEALFAISYALNSHKGHQLAANIAADVVLETLERQGFVLMRKPPHQCRGWRRSASRDGPVTLRRSVRL